MSIVSFGSIPNIDLLYVQPTVAAVVAMAAGMDTFGPTKGVATLLVFAGVWLVTRSRSRSDSEVAAKK